MKISMEAISLKLPREFLEESRRCAEAMRLSRAAYFRHAIDQMNRETRSKLRAQRLAQASRKVRKESLRVNAEFSAIEGDPDA